MNDYEYSVCPDYFPRTIYDTFWEAEKAANDIRPHYPPGLVKIQRRKITYWEDYPGPSCPYTFGHTRQWCGNPECRES